MHDIEKFIRMNVAEPRLLLRSFIQTSQSSCVVEVLFSSKVYLNILTSGYISSGRSSAGEFFNKVHMDETRLKGRTYELCVSLRSDNQRTGLRMAGPRWC